MLATFQMRFVTVVSPPARHPLGISPSIVSAGDAIDAASSTDAWRTAFGLLVGMAGGRRDGLAFSAWATTELIADDLPAIQRHQRDTPSDCHWRQQPDVTGTVSWHRNAFRIKPFSNTNPDRRTAREIPSGSPHLDTPLRAPVQQREQGDDRRGTLAAVIRTRSCLDGAGANLLFCSHQKLRYRAMAMFLALPQRAGAAAVTTYDLLRSQNGRAIDVHPPGLRQHRATAAWATC